MTFSEREKRLLLITVAAALLGVLILGWKFVSNQIVDSTVSEATAERFEDLFAKIKNVESQKNANLLLRKKLGNESGEFIGEDEILKLIAEIEQVAGKSGVQMKNWNPTINKRTKPLAQLDVKVNLECQFDQLINFFNNLRSAKYICQPVALRTKLKDANQPNLEVSMTLTTYLVEAKPEPVSPSLVQR